MSLIWQFLLCGWKTLADQTVWSCSHVAERSVGHSLSCGKIEQASASSAVSSGGCRRGFRLQERKHGRTEPAEQLTRLSNGLRTMIANTLLFLARYRK
jgi:hypothetical protein